MFATILIVMGFFLVIFALTGLSLHFSKYKKRPTACHCGQGGSCEDNHRSENVEQDSVNLLQ